MTSSAQETYVNYMNKIVANRLSMTAMIVENNFYNYALGTDKFRYEPSETQMSMSLEELRAMYFGEPGINSIREYKTKRQFVLPEGLAPF